MNPEITTPNIVPLWDSGVYINTKQLISRTQRWIEETPYKVRRKQVENFVTTGILILTGVLLVLALTKKN